MTFRCPSRLLRRTVARSATWQSPYAPPYAAASSAAASAAEAEAASVAASGLSGAAAEALVADARRRAPAVALAAALPRRVLTAAQFEELVSRHGAAPEAVAALEAAGMIVRLDDGALVHCFPPAAAFVEANAALPHPDDVAGPAARSDAAAADPADAPPALAQWDPCLVERGRLADIDAELSRLQPGYDATVALARRSRQRWWAAAVAGGGMQLGLISRLTFFDLEWDIMEPISYFIGTGTALLFFVYMLRYGAEHSAVRFDAHRLRPILEQSPEARRYLELRAARRAAQAAVEEKARWFEGPYAADPVVVVEAAAAAAASVGDEIGGQSQR